VMQHDTVVDNGSGAVVLVEMQDVLQALATCMSGAVEPATKTPGMFWLDTSVAGGFLRQRNRDNTDWAVVAGIPAKASAAEAAAGVDDSKYVTPLGVAQAQAAAITRARNRIVNPAMQVSQENGDTLGAVSSYYAADQWFAPFIGAVCSFQRVASVTPRGSPKRLRLIVTTAKPALAAGDFTSFFQYMEGIKVADFAWGTAGARRIIVRFGWRSPAGTYALNIRNSGRTYTKTFTISAADANLDTEQVFVIPGDVVGALVADNTLSVVFSVTVAAGTTYQGVEGWQPGVMLATAACSNGMDTVGKTFELFDVGLYLDLDGTGVPPPFQFPDEASELRACQRYYCPVFIMYSNNLGVATTWYTIAALPVDLRTGSPTFTHINSSSSSNFPATVAFAGIVGTRTLRVGRAATAAGTSSQFSQTTIVNARM
jgi:hypothetical protein